MVVRLYFLPPQPTTSFWLIPVWRVLRQNQQHVGNAAVAGVGGVIYIGEVDAESMRRPQNRDNIEALDGIKQCHASGHAHD